MFCINCFHKNTSTVNSRPSKKLPRVWRRHLCPKCGEAFTTYERPSLADNKKITTSDNKFTTFNLGRLIISIAASFTHNPMDGKENALWLAQSIESILLLDTRPLTSQVISQTTYDVLKRYDELAAMQYAAKHRLISSVRQRGRPSTRELEQPTDA